MASFSILKFSLAIHHHITSTGKTCNTQHMTFLGVILIGMEDDYYIGDEINIKAITIIISSSQSSLQEVVLKETVDRYILFQ